MNQHDCGCFCVFYLLIPFPLSSLTFNLHPWHLPPSLLLLPFPLFLLILLDRHLTQKRMYTSDMYMNH